MNYLKAGVIILGVILGAAIFVLKYLSKTGHQRESSPPSIRVEEADLEELIHYLHIQRVTELREAPGFTLPSLTGKRVSLEDYRGRHLLLVFWTTW